MKETPGLIPVCCMLPSSNWSFGLLHSSLLLWPECFYTFGLIVALYLRVLLINLFILLITSINSERKQKIGCQCSPYSYIIPCTQTPTRTSSATGLQQSEASLRKGLTYASRSSLWYWCVFSNSFMWTSLQRENFVMNKEMRRFQAWTDPSHRLTHKVYAWFAQDIYNASIDSEHYSTLP